MKFLAAVLGLAVLLALVGCAVTMTAQEFDRPSGRSPILDAQDEATRWAERAVVVFVTATALGFVPWGWYFFLARLREIAAIFRG